MTGRLANSGKRCVGRHSTGVSSAPSCSGRRHFSTGPCWPSSAFPESPAAHFQALERVVVVIREVAFCEVGKTLTLLEVENKFQRKIAFRVPAKYRAIFLNYLAENRHQR